MNNKITTIGITALTATLLTLSGCSPIMRAAKLEQKIFEPDTMKFYSVKEHIELNQPKYVRGLVDLIIDQDLYDELIEFYAGDNAHFQRVYGPSYSLDTVREEYDLISVATVKTLLAVGGAFFVPKSAKVEVGDIIDVYWQELTADSYEALARREYNEYAAYFMDRGFFMSVEIPTHPNAHIAKHSPQFLAIVCKHDEAGCKYNSSPKTKIGFIRYGVNQHYDYKGPANEFVLNDDAYVSKWFSNCFGCDDEADREYLRQKGLIK